MGGEGFMMHMNKSLKENRAAKRSNRIGFKDGFDGITLSKKKLKFKQLPPEELEKVLREIRISKRKEKRRNLIIFWLIMMGLSSLTTLVIYLNYT